MTISVIPSKDEAPWPFEAILCHTVLLPSDARILDALLPRRFSLDCQLTLRAGAFIFCSPEFSKFYRSNPDQALPRAFFLKINP